MSDVWLGAKRKRKHACFWEWRYRVFGHPLNQPPRLAVRDGDYKLLMNPDRSRVELYNIVQDPSELQNLATAQPELAERLAKKLLDWNGTLPESPVEAVAGKNDWNWPRTPLGGR
jgi:arylsulfatase A-like enzyme